MNLKEITQKELDKTEKIILNFPWENPIAYAMWLCQSYYMVCHSTRLVALAGAHTQIGNEKLHARFVDHSKEERGHQMICINDLKNLGYTLEDFPVTMQSQVMYQIQYYWIQFRGASSFFGYTLALECLAERFGPELARRTKLAHGQQASKFLILHSEADQEHTEAAFEALEHVPDNEKNLIKENLIISSEIYRSMLSEVIKEYQFLNKNSKIA